MQGAISRMRLRPLPVAGSPPRPATTGRRTLGAAVVALLGLAVLAAALLPRGPWRASDPLPVPAGPAIALGHVLAAAGGLALLACSWSLLLGRRRASILAAGGLFAAATLRLLYGAPLPATLLEALLGTLLLLDRRSFPCRGPRGPIGAAWAVAGLALGGAYVLAVAALLQADATGIDAVTRATGWLTAGGWWLRSGEPLAVALDLLLVTALGAAAIVLRALLRPAEGAEGHTCDEHARAAAVVATWASDSLHPFVLREDKSFHFAHGGVLAYRTLGETAVVSGDPIGPPGAAPAVLASFEAFASEGGWNVVVTGASERELSGYRQLGFRALRIGDEAVVRPAEFSLAGRRIRKVRQAVARVQRRGWSVDVREAAELGPSELEALEAIERAWRAAQPRLYGFAMTLGRLWGAEEDASAVYALARDPEGRVRCFLRFAAYRRGLSLDVMRRLEGAPNGINEALIVAAIEYARERGHDEVSLNFAGFSHVMAAEGPLPAWQRVLRWSLRRMHRRFQLERLVLFNGQFQPEWRPRHLVHRGPVLLPLAALRVLQAEAYVRPPRRRPLAARWQPGAEPVGAPGLPAATA
jgi:lysyl-tRNA synthetase, class II